MKVIIIGTMQGSLPNGIHDQTYRKPISIILNKVIPGIKIIDPDKLHPNRLSYNFIQAKNMFMTYLKESTKVDLVVAYISEASMGTAIEIWEAYKAKIPIITISNLKNNWVIKLFSTKIVSNIGDFSDYISSLGFKKIIQNRI